MPQMVEEPVQKYSYKFIFKIETENEIIVCLFPESE